MPPVLHLRRTTLCLVILLVAPFAAYAPAIFHEYGFRDDYSLQRESHESPHDLIRFTSSYGRPLYGTLLVASLRFTETVTDFQWPRGLSVLLLALVATALWRTLQAAGWPTGDALAAGLAIVFLPSAQVFAGWAIAWPIAFAALCALGGFRAAEAALAAGSGRRAAYALAGVALYVTAAVTYQPGALFAIVPLAGCALVRNDAARQRLNWAAAHLGLLFGGIAIALGVMQLIFSLGAVPPAAAIAFETDPLGKLGWFVRQPLANALALFALRDRLDTDAIFWIAASVSVLLLVATTVLGPRLERGIDRATWWFCLLVLPVAAHGISLVAAPRTVGYRTLWPLAGLIVVLVIDSLRRLRGAGRLSPPAHAALLALAVTVAGAFAARHAYTLIAEPQGREWALVRNGVRELPTGQALDVFIVRPRMEERSTRRIFADEFGSLSTNSDWATVEMFNAALRARFPNGLPNGTSYAVASGLDAPPDTPTPDAVIDMRPLRELRVD